MEIAETEIRVANLSLDGKKKTFQLYITSCHLLTYSEMKSYGCFSASDSVSG